MKATNLTYKEAGKHHPDSMEFNDQAVSNTSSRITIIKGFYSKCVLGFEIFYDDKYTG